ncbi:hypothetical protein OUZ56_027585 [Daphnia magna]|uniref:Secreted protein n=1 Tax=Daphnia magna TaxID=35525 RepID=A0ABR0B1B4_9CRUS|nr:hypothetical protein OUZ56_027585 [Daphnia magna]
MRNAVFILILQAQEVLLYQQLMVVINAALTCSTSFTVELRLFPSELLMLFISFQTSAGLVFSSLVTFAVRCCGFAVERFCQQLIV